MKRPFQVSEELYPFESRWLEVDGIPVHYIDEGQGKPILFCHGNPTWSFLYRDIIRDLRSDYRCIAIDYPGMGMSGKPRHHGRDDYQFLPQEHSAVLERVVDELDLTNLTVMVQDWGGPIGTGFATRQPDRVDRMVIGNTWAWPADSLDMRIFSSLLGRGLGRQWVLRRNGFVERLIPAGCTRKDRLTPQVMEAYRAPYPTRQDREPTAVFPRAIVTARDYLVQVQNGLDRLRDKPVQFVWGNKDKAFKKRELTRWTELFPEANVRMLDGAGHFIQEDAPEAIVETIRGFVG